MPPLRLLAFAASLVVAGTLPAGDDEQPATAQVEWGEPVHGLKLHVHLDLDAYMSDRDLVNVTFTILNTTAKDFPVTLGLTGEERTDLVIRDAAGRRAGWRIASAATRPRAGRRAGGS